jgi:hypothetical protein
LCDNYIYDKVFDKKGYCESDRMGQVGFYKKGEKQQVIIMIYSCYAKRTKIAAFLCKLFIFACHPHGVVV